MKFSHLTAFQKHLQSADPSHLSSLYLIVDPCEYAQKKHARQVALEQEQWLLYSADELSLGKIDEIFNGFSMFADQSCVCIVGVDKLSKSILKSLLEQLKKPLINQRVVLTASKLTRDFASFVKTGIVLDLSLEKPWDREKRLSQDVMKKLMSAKLRAPVAICDQIVKLCGAQEAMIDQEVEKLQLYLYGKSEITRADLKFILASTEQSIFKIGQALTEKNLREAMDIYQSQKFPLMMLIYSLRTVLQRGYRLKGLNAAQIAQDLPQIKGYMLQKSLQLSQQFTHQQFQKVLSILFEVELMMKSQSVHEELLSSMLLMKIGGVLQ